MTHWNPGSLEELPARLWAALASAAADPAHPFRLATLGTAAPAGCALRTVILRAADQAARRLAFYTDARSAKVAEIRRQPRVAWLFYDAVEKVQVRAEATAQIHHGDELAGRVWEKLPSLNRVNYGTKLPPGAVIADAAEARPSARPEAAAGLANTTRGRNNFAVIHTIVDRWEWLWLAPDGHRRAAFDWTGKNFTGHWLTP